MSHSHASFVHRHVGTSSREQHEMLAAVGVASLAELIESSLPSNIRLRSPITLPQAKTEEEALAQLKAIADKNVLKKSFIGQGYYGTFLPNVIARNVLENPAWYTAYTPYQPEISQGRLEVLMMFQTMICDLTGMDIANASLLDEATAAAEAMTMAMRVKTAKDKVSNIFFVVNDVFQQTLDVIATRAKSLDIHVATGSISEAAASNAFAVLLQYPDANGAIHEYAQLVEAVHARGGKVIVAADLLALTMLEAPGVWGADIVVGCAQRFGVPMGFGGPHAGFLATRDAFKRSMPGRLVGLSIDAQGAPAYRLALQTREQHIRREKATSNICTAQVLLAVLATLYAAYHGPRGLLAIAERIHRYTCALKAGLIALEATILNTAFFDTLTITPSGGELSDLHEQARALGMNFREIDASALGISIDETTTLEDLDNILVAFDFALSKEKWIAAKKTLREALAAPSISSIPPALRRKTAYLTHEKFNRYYIETEMMRFLRQLADKDLALDRTMISLGSCTMKLNAATAMTPISWAAFTQMHPFVPAAQAAGYREMIDDLTQRLCAVTGYDAFSFQPNSGAQGEYAGLVTIRAYHESRGDTKRNICLIPQSAHGTNPASAQMAGMRVIVVENDANGNIDIADLETHAQQHAEELACAMITYPSTHGVFEESIRAACDIVHRYGGQVYIDGANMNALVGLAAPGLFGGDVSHLNLHKTFAIPHGGGGPGVGPIGVKRHLAPFLPGHSLLKNAARAVSAAPYGSASILPITWMYLAMMGADGLRHATESAILSANYIARRLKEHYPVLFSGRNGFVAHECILDMRQFKESANVEAEDIAKRLIDFGFHAPTMSFPVPGTLMIEPTESESKNELDRFIEAMLAIREEIHAIENGKLDKENNPLKNAPHPADAVCADTWNHPYSRQQAAYPLPLLKEKKYWSPVARVDNVYGDRHLICRLPE
ncbi:MAG: aminomethyl-transferring glycine dehydrogenase [Burkholderiales bacterium]|jgi:glycine dehydrogenase|nr:aminomethyl-transferring glycine dehydrogenase [Burkholderiales bacterium]